MEYRGKYGLNHEWVYGYYYNNCDCGVNQNIIVSPDYENGTGLHTIVNYPYINKSTNLKDKNGTNIYVGDILKQTLIDNTFRLYIVFEVKGGFAINTHIDDVTKPISEIHWYEGLSCMQNASFIEGCCEIIGNMYDNPELVGIKNAGEQKV